MPGIGGLSIADNLSANSISLNLAKTQTQLRRSIARLSTGLRVTSAADDPSGLAIASKLQSQVSGFDQSSRNVQDANNAAMVASGALQTIAKILQRARNLATEASTDIISSDDRQALQAEMHQLLLEVNRIAQNTTFNQLTLLDGSHEGVVAAQTASVAVTSNSVLASPGPPATNPGFGGSPLPAAPSDDLVMAVSLPSQIASQEPQLQIAMLGNAVASNLPQTVQVTSPQALAPGMTLVAQGGNAVITVISTNPANGTMTAFFSQAVGVGTSLFTTFFATSANPVGIGQQVMTLNPVGGSASPLYAGEVLKFVGTPQTVTVQRVLGADTFLANFTAPHAAGALMANFDSAAIAPPPPTTVTLGSAPDGDPAPVGSTAWVIETGAGTPATVVGTGTVDSATASTETVDIPTYQVLNAGDSFNVYTRIDNSDVLPLDGTVELQVVNSGGVAAVQETYYDTAGQTQTVAPQLLNPDERAMLQDGAITTLGNFTLADVGLTAYIKVLQATSGVASQVKPALSIQSGPNEGAALQLGIPAMNTQTLRLSGTVLSNTLSSEDAISQIDFALGQVLTTSAQVGAVVVRLGQDEYNNNIASVNLQASASAILDLNVPKESSTETRLQILGRIGTSVLGHANSNARSILTLFQ